MARNKSVHPYSLSTDEQIKQSIRAIIDQLANHGRAITDNKKASRVLSRSLDEPVRQQHIYFTWDRERKKILITLPPSITLKRCKGNKIKLEVNKDFGSGE